jgi:hypothetical protein
MSTLKRTIIAILVIICISASGSAQQLSVQQKDAMGRRAAEKVGQMNDYISQMAKKKTRGVSKAQDRDNRMYIKEKALNLFIGKGYEYTENSVPKRGVLMQTTSLRRSTTNSTLMRDYFQKVIDLRYSDVDISATEIAAIKVSNLNRVDDNTWVCTCEYDQAFVGYRDGRAVYKDITTKRIKCYLKIEQTAAGAELIVLLGDVDAIKTRRK